MDASHRVVSDCSVAGDMSAQELTQELERVAARIASSNPSRSMIIEIAIDRSPRCDSRQISELLNQLASHALRNGDADRPISMAVATAADALTISVVARGERLASESRRWSRGELRGDTQSRHGSGMNLFLASEIGHALGGSIEASTSADSVRTTFTMPLHALAEDAPARPEATSAV